MCDPATAAQKASCREYYITTAMPCILFAHINKNVHQAGHVDHLKKTRRPGFEHRTPARPNATHPAALYSHIVGRLSSNTYRFLNVRRGLQASSLVRVSGDRPRLPSSVARPVHALLACSPQQSCSIANMDGRGVVKKPIKSTSLGKVCNVTAASSPTTQRVWPS